VLSRWGGARDNARVLPLDADLLPRTVLVRAGVEDVEWTLLPTRPQAEWSMTLVGPDQTWTGTGGNCFASLRDLRIKLDTQRLRIGLNGARPECTVSGMLADMGEGRSVYVLVIGAQGRPDTLRTLDPAPLDAVGSVAEQDAFAERWLAERRSQPQG